MDDKKALTIALKTDSFLDKNSSLAEASSKILDLILRETNAKRGSISIFNPLTKDLEVLSKKGMTNKKIILECFRSDKEVVKKNKVAVPIALEKEKSGVIFIAGKLIGGAIDYVRTIEKILDGKFKEEKEKLEFKNLFQRYVGEKTLRKILKSAHKEYTEGERSISTILFADINNFTEFSNKENPRVVLDLLNEFFKKMSEIVFSRGGTVDKFIGDEIMAVFGSPLPQKNHSTIAIKVAKEMLKKVKPILKKYGLENSGLSVGIATGRVVSGSVGSEKMSDYTVIGKKVNLAARLTSIAKKNEIIVDGVTKNNSKSFSYSEMPSQEVKGFGRISFFRVL